MVVVVVEVGLDEDEASLFLFTILDRPRPERGRETAIGRPNNRETRECLETAECRYFELGATGAEGVEEGASGL